MRRAARVDGNHSDIAAALRQAGCSVLDLSRVGQGCLDLLVSRNGQTWFIEVKDGRKPPSERCLTPAQKRFAGDWRGSWYIVLSVEEALDTITKEVGGGLNR